VRPVGSEEVAKLREIGEVRTAVLEAANGQRAFARGWMIAGLVALTGSGACLGLFLLARDIVRTEWDYVSPGVLMEGEPLEAFDVVIGPLDPNDARYEANVKRRLSMIPRLDEKKLTSVADFGLTWIEKVGNNLRYYRLRATREVADYSPLRWFLVPALALFAGVAGCGNISLRWR
jgi:hypothetical protein